MSYLTNIFVALPVLNDRFNFAYEIDFAGNTVGLWASTGGAALTKVVANVATSASTVGALHAG